MRREVNQVAEGRIVEAADLPRLPFTRQVNPGNPASVPTRLADFARSR